MTKVYDNEKWISLHVSMQEIREAQDIYEQTKEFQLALSISDSHCNLEEFNVCEIEEIELIK